MARAKAPEVERLDRILKVRAAEAQLVERLEGNKVRCLACGHRCVILDGLDGVCRVRFNRDGTLYAPRGYVAGLQADPIEKKPFFHVLPGATALSFGMLGCDFHCSYCQNWISSQTLRDARALSPVRDISAERIVAMAREEGADVVVSTYNEPLITSEWAVEVFRLAKAEGLVCGYVSNGNATPEVLDYLRPWVDLYKVDLKAFRPEAYRDLGGRLDVVLDTIRRLHAMGFWVEIVTLLVPGFNDSRRELRELASFVAGVSPDIPWHVTAFHADYEMRDSRDTTVDDLQRAAALGREEGLRYVYAGNLPGSVGDLEDTRCGGCGRTLVSRLGFHVTGYDLADGGRCGGCGTPVAGYWRDGWSVPGGSRSPRRPRALHRLGEDA
jgi:pyruvate formate lyase activating enzyme